MSKPRTDKADSKSRKAFVRILLGSALLVPILALSSCSTGYILRASFEEAGILWKKRPIEDVLKDKAVDDETKTKLRMVLDAREFAKSLGLTPSGSYTEYSKVDRDVLVYVLSAAPKASLDPYTWWFPVVGSVPYKGFFDLDDAKAEGEKLAKKNLDFSIRGSAAFSTLGWFDDPLLSTVVRNDQVALIDTVLHEILHQTIWINGSVAFNETLANFVGSRSSAQFFKERFGEHDERYLLAQSRWVTELDFSREMKRLTDELAPLYAQVDSLGVDQIVERRKAVFAAAAERWGEHGQEKSIYSKVLQSPNNATLIGMRTYLTDLELFQKLFQRSGESLPKFLELMRGIAKDAEAQGVDPYEVLRKECGES